MKDGGGEGGEEGISGLNANDSLEEGNCKHTLLARPPIHERAHKHNEHSSVGLCAERCTHYRKTSAQQETEKHMQKHWNIPCAHTLSFHFRY